MARKEKSYAPRSTEHVKNCTYIYSVLLKLKINFLRLHLLFRRLRFFIIFWIEKNLASMPRGFLYTPNTNFKQLPAFPRFGKHVLPSSHDTLSSDSGNPSEFSFPREVHWGVMSSCTSCQSISFPHQKRKEKKRKRAARASAEPPRAGRSGRSYKRVPRWVRRRFCLGRRESIDFFCACPPLLWIHAAPAWIRCSLLVLAYVHVPPLGSKLIYEVPKVHMAF